MDATPITVLNNVFETMQVFLSWSEDVHLILGLSSRYFFIKVFDLVFSSRIDTLWAQLLLEFSLDHLETVHTCSTWYEEVCVVLGLSCHYLFSTFCTIST